MARLAPAIEKLLTECVFPFRELPASSSASPLALPNGDPAELCISIQNLTKVHHLASRDAACGGRRMQLPIFLQVISPLFLLRRPTRTTHSSVFSVDVVVCLLQDCHGITLESDYWKALKDEIGFHHHEIYLKSKSNTDRADPTTSTGPCTKSRRIMRCDSDDQFSESQGDQSSQDQTSDSFSFRLSNEFSEDDCNPVSISEADDASSSYASGSDSSEITRRNSALSFEVKVLKELLMEKEKKISEQKQTIKYYQVKSNRQNKSLTKLMACMKRTKLSSTEFEPTRVKGNKHLQQQVRQLDGGLVDKFLKFESSVDQVDPGEEKGWLTPQGAISLAVRRNLSNASAESLGLIVLTDVSKQSVLRSECRTAAALIANARLMFEEWAYHCSNMDSSSRAFWFLQYREDATNASKHKQKMTALELHASFVICSDASLSTVTAGDFQNIRRLADVLPVDDSTGLGTMALTTKMLQSLGCPTWDTLLSEYESNGPILSDQVRNIF